MTRLKHLALFKSEIRAGKGRPEIRIAISRKVVRLATQRNRWRRRIREILRKQKNLVLPEQIVTFKVHSVTTMPKHRELRQEILELLKQSGLLKEGQG